MDCPKCGHENLLGSECPACGIVVSKYLAIQARKKTSEQHHEGNETIDNTSSKPDLQPISLSAGYEDAGLLQYLIKHKKFVIAIFILISLLGLVLLIQQITNLMNHVSTLNRLGILLGILVGVKLLADRWLVEKRRQRRKSYYHDEYLKSDDWKRKRSLVLKRDNHRCVFCGQPATQVHHKQYAPQNIGREPIELLVSVCNACHGRQHGK